MQSVIKSITLLHQIDVIYNKLTWIEWMNFEGSNFAIDHCKISTKLNYTPYILINSTKDGQSVYWNYFGSLIYIKPSRNVMNHIQCYAILTH